MSTHPIFGALQETALAIGHADDTERARAEFGAASRWLVETLLRAPEPS